MSTTQTDRQTGHGGQTTLYGSIKWPTDDNKEHGTKGAQSLGVIKSFAIAFYLTWFLLSPVPRNTLRIHFLNHRTGHKEPLGGWLVGNELRTGIMKISTITGIPAGAAKTFD